MTQTTTQTTKTPAPSFTVSFGESAKKMKDTTVNGFATARQLFTIRVNEGHRTVRIVCDAGDKKITLAKFDMNAIAR